jgi:hypothetical protein
MTSCDVPESAQKTAMVLGGENCTSLSQVLNPKDAVLEALALASREGDSETVVRLTQVLSNLIKK